MDGEREFSDSVERHESRLVEIIQAISRLQALQLDELEWLDEAQVFTADGVHNLAEWAAQKLDIGLGSARGLVRTMRRCTDKPWLREALAAGMSFDRVEALSRIDDSRDLLEHLDVAAVHRRATDLIEISREDESRSFEDRFLILQPSLDESWWTVFGGLDGLAGAIIDQALTRNADQLPNLPDGSFPGLGWRKATALLELAGGGASPRAEVTVFVDADQANQTGGRSGVRLEAGPRVGAQAISAILCDSTTELIVTMADGTPLKYGRATRTTPRALNRAVLAQTGGYCAADACSNRYRVEVHHITPWADGGSTDPENLVPLCWFHHHIVVHERGLELFKHPDHGRIRFRKPLMTETDPDPPHQ